MMAQYANAANERPRRRRWPWVLAALVLGMFFGWLSGSLQPWTFSTAHRQFLALVLLLSVTLMSSEIVRVWHEKQRLLANLCLVLGTTQMQVAQFWNERTFRSFVALAALSWLALLVLPKRARRSASVCVWLCGASLASAVLFR